MKTQEKIIVIFISMSSQPDQQSSIRSNSFSLFSMHGRDMNIETVFGVILLSTIFTYIEESPRKMNRFDMINDIWLLRACLAAHSTLK